MSEAHKWGLDPTLTDEGETGAAADAPVESAFFAVPETEIVETRNGPRLPEGFHDATVRARLAQSGLVLCAALYVVMGGLSLYGPLGVESDLLWAVSDAIWQVVEPLEIVMRVTTAIAFLAWVHRASSNAHAIGDPTPQHSPGSAVGAWFVPCANLWLPYQVVSELDRLSDPDGNGRTSGWTSAWWAAWIGGNALSRAISAGIGLPAVMGIVAVQVAAAALAFGVVERITKNQLARANRADAATIAETFA